jgi:para-nitrobenzyl esterase
MAVYVYIHGGVFTVGSGNQGIFDGRNMANDLGKKDMVVVDVNYRLHALGFMALNYLETQALGDLDQPINDANGKPIMTDGN